jgi:hypothetical protein
MKCFLYVILLVINFACIATNQSQNCLDDIRKASINNWKYHSDSNSYEGTEEFKKLLSLKIDCLKQHTISELEAVLGPPSSKGDSNYNYKIFPFSDIKGGSKILNFIFDVKTKKITDLTVLVTTMTIEE